MRGLRVSLFLAARSVARSNYGIAATTTLMLLLIYISLLFLPSLIQGAVNRANERLIDTLTSNIVITPAGKATSITDVNAYLSKIRQTAGVQQATAVFHVGTQVAYGADSGSWTVDAIDPASYGQVFSTPIGHVLRPRAHHSRHRPGAARDRDRRRRPNQNPRIPSVAGDRAR